MEYEFNILYYINIYKKWWKTIVKIALIAMVLTTCFALTTPVSYISTVTILSADSGGSGGSLGKFLGLAGLSGGGAGDAIIPIINSKRMAKDISEQFNLAKKPKFRYGISIRTGNSILVVDVKGTDPGLTEKIANFVIQNLDKLNVELNITSSKPMVKVLDPATYGSPLSRQILRKAIIAGMLAFLLVSIYAFFSNYFRQLKSKQ